EQLRVLQAHYAGAVPLDLLKKEQDRISAALETIEHRITAHHGEYADARANLDDSLDLLEHAPAIYARCDDAYRRLCNQAFFTAIDIDEHTEVKVGYATPFDARTDRELQTNALAWAEDARNESEVRTPTGSTVESSHLAHLGWLLLSGLWKLAVVDDVAGDLVQLHIVVLGVTAKHVERRLRREPEALHQDPLGLTDQRPVVQRQPHGLRGTSGEHCGRGMVA